MEGEIQAKIDNLNKPKGSLGRLEELALQVCLVQQTLSPSLAHPCHLLFGGDHGIEREGVSISPREVTWQQMINFTHGGGGVNMFCRQHGFKLRVVDVGVDYDLSGTAGIIDRKIARGTRNFLYEAAMTEEQYERAIAVGAEMADACIAEGCRVLSIGEMGIGNTSPSSIWMSVFGGIPLEECIGAGAGLDRPGVRHKVEVLKEAVERWRSANGPEGDERRATRSATGPEGDEEREEACCRDRRQEVEDVLRYFGGYEMVAAIGAMLRAAERQTLVLVDGFIMTACALGAARLYPASQDYMIFTHCGDESGHGRLLDVLGARPLLHLGLRLGEGTGALCAFPLVDSAVRMMNEMNNFANARITKYF